MLWSKKFFEKFAVILKGLSCGGIEGCIPHTGENNDHRLKLTKDINHELESEQFINHSKDGNEGVFTRRRKLTIKDVILFLLKFKSSTQRELDRLQGDFPKRLQNSRGDHGYLQLSEGKTRLLGLPTAQRGRR